MGVILDLFAAVLDGTRTFEKIEEPISLEDLLPKRSMMVESSFHRKQSGAAVHGLYFGDNPAQTHKFNLSEVLLDYAFKHGYQIVSVISAGSYLAALHLGILTNYPNMQLIELVAKDSLPTEDQAKGYSIDNWIDDPAAPKRIRIAADLSKYLPREAREKHIEKIISKSDELKAILKEQGITGRPRDLDVTNADEIPGIKGPIYDISPDLLRNYKLVISPGGSLKMAYALADSILQLPVEERPELMVVIPGKHPFVRPKKAKTVRCTGPLLKLRTDFECPTADRLEKIWSEMNACLYSPPSNLVHLNTGLTSNIGDEFQQYPFHELAASETAIAEFGVLRLHYQTEFTGLEFKPGEPCDVTLNSSGAAALIPLLNFVKGGQVIPEGYHLTSHPELKRFPYGGWFIPGGLQRHPHEPEDRGRLISSRDTLTILTGKGISLKAIKSQAQALYDSACKELVPST